MISLLVWLLVLLVVVYVAHLVIETLKLPENIKKIAYIIVGLIALLMILGQLGVTGSPWVGTPVYR